MYCCHPYHFLQIYKPPVNEPIGSYTQTKRRVVHVVALVRTVLALGSPYYEGSATLVSLAFLFKSMVPAILEGLYPPQAYPCNTPYPVIFSQICQGNQDKSFELYWKSALE